MHNRAHGLRTRGPVLKLLGAIIAAALASAAAAQAVNVGEATARGQAALNRGDHDAAVRELAPAATAAPDNAEVLRLYGVALGRAGRTDEAMAALRRAAAIAPNDVDIWLATAQVHYYRAEIRDAAMLVRRVLTARPNDEDAADLAVRLAQARRETYGPPWRFDMSGSYSHFEKDARRRWLEGSVGVGYRPDESTGVYGRVDVAERFDLTDVYLEGGVDHRFNADWNAGFSFGATAGPDFLPQWAAQARVGRRAWHNAVVSLEGRFADYRTGSVETLTPTVEQYLWNGRAWITGKLVVTWDEDGDRQEGFILRGDVLPSERLRLFAGYADAPETINNATLTTRTLFGGAIVDLDERYSLRLDYARDDREASYVRHVFGLGFTARY